MIVFNWKDCSKLFVVSTIRQTSGNVSEFIWALKRIQCINANQKQSPKNLILSWSAFSWRSKKGWGSVGDCSWLALMLWILFSERSGRDAAPCSAGYKQRHRGKDYIKRHRRQRSGRPWGGIWGGSISEIVNFPLQSFRVMRRNHFQLGYYFFQKHGTANDNFAVLAL